MLLGRVAAAPLVGVARRLREALRGRDVPSDNVEAMEVADVAEEREMDVPSSTWWGPLASSMLLLLLLFRVEMFSMTPSSLFSLSSSSPRGMSRIGDDMMSNIMTRQGHKDKERCECYVLCARLGFFCFQRGCGSCC